MERTVEENKHLNDSESNRNIINAFSRNMFEDSFVAVPNTNHKDCLSYDSGEDWATEKISNGINKANANSKGFKKNRTEKEKLIPLKHL
jgi:hypothetical protein